MRKAFTMTELVFVIVVIGILAAIAVPKLSATRDDAKLTKAESIVANVRTALNSEVQKRILQGIYEPITNVGGTTGSNNADIFDFFGDKNGQTTDRVLEYPIKSCQSAASAACWMRTGASKYTYYLPAGVIPGSGRVGINFTVNNGRFVCDKNDDHCDYLER